MGPIGYFLATISIIIFISWSCKIYNTGMSLYWDYKNIERQHTVLKMKRFTILKNILNQLGVWGQYEKDIIKMSAGTSQAIRFLKTRFPDIKTMGMVSTYWVQLINIEKEINTVLQNRVVAASKWYKLSDNIIVNLFVPGYEDVPRDLLGKVRDPIVGEKELTKMRKEY